VVRLTHPSFPPSLSLSEQAYSKTAAAAAAVAAAVEAAAVVAVADAQQNVRFLLSVCVFFSLRIEVISSPHVDPSFPPSLPHRSLPLPRVLVLGPARISEGRKRLWRTPIISSSTGQKRRPPTHSSLPPSLPPSSLPHRSLPLPRVLILGPARTSEGRKRL